MKSRSDGIPPPDTGKSHLLVALSVAAVHDGHKVRYFTAAGLAETLHRGLAENSVGKVIDTLLRNDLIIIDEVGSPRWMTLARSCCSRVVAAACERRALGIASHRPLTETTAGLARDSNSRHPGPQQRIRSLRGPDSRRFPSLRA